MQYERIREFRLRQPFVPFDLKLSDGRVFTVDRPECLAIARNGKTVTFFTQDDRAVFWDTRDIAAVEATIPGSRP